MKKAGLNPALLYGMSGGGGATAAGAQGMGAGIASGHEMGIKQQGRGTINYTTGVVEITPTRVASVYKYELVPTLYTAYYASA